MPTANQDYFDTALRHQIGVRRFASGEVKKILSLLEKADRELVEKLRKRLIKLGHVTDFTSMRYTKLIESIRKNRAKAMKALRQELTPDLVEFGRLETGFETRALEAAIPIEIEFATVEVAKIREIALRRPFQGRLLKDWYATLQQADQKRLRESIQLGMTQGESVPTMMQRIAGTRANRFRDGVLSITRREAETVVRTAVNHVSNRAREAVFDENSDVIRALRWTSTLDGRTSAICRARDGQMAVTEGNSLREGELALQPPGARPPAHPNCRSVVVAVIDETGVVGTRPSVTDTRRRERREVDFRKISKSTGKPIKQVRSEWADRNIGTVPAKTTYNQWLKRQPAEFQDEVLGSTKGKLFRSGKVDVQEFVDRRGGELTLAQLSRTRPEAFTAAGLDPGDF